MAKNGQTAEIASFLIERLSAMRVKNNFSQRELSLRIGKESSYINRMEQSKFIPSVDTLYAIVEACNASMEELFYYDMEQYPADAELLKLFRCFSKEKRKRSSNFCRRPENKAAAGGALVFKRGPRLF